METGDLVGCWFRKLIGRLQRILGIIMESPLIMGIVTGGGVKGLLVLL